MLHWLPSVLPKKSPLFFRLFILVAIFHILLIMSYAFLARPKPLVIHVSRGIIRSDRAIRVLPFVRNTGQLNRVFEKAGKSNTSRSGVSADKLQKNKLRMRRSVQGKVGVEPGAKKSEKKIKNAQDFVQRSQKIKIKKSKKGQKKGVNETAKIADKPIAVPVVVPIEKSIKQRLEPKQIIEKDKAIVEKLIPKIEPEPVLIESTVELVDQTQDLPVAQGPIDVELGALGDESPIVLGQEEFEILQTCQAIYEQMNQQWHPPAGLHPAKQCIILVTINNQGSGSQMQVEQSSGVLAYDLAARMAVSRAQFPKNVWDQQVRLHF